MSDMAGLPRDDEPARDPLSAITALGYAVPAGLLIWGVGIALLVRWLLSR